MADTYQGQAAIPPGLPSDVVFERVRDRLFVYDIFPTWFIQGTSFPPGPLTLGAIVVQRVVLGPVAAEMAVRVVEIWDREHGDGTREAGFRYVTLAGHVERGVASFEVRASPTGEVTVLLGARSLPGNLLARLGRPIARRIQQAMTRAAVRRLVEAGASS